MQNLTDDDRMSTQLEGKKLKGFGARFGKVFNKFIEESLGLQGSLELDDERGIQAEEIIFDEHGNEVEEKKKREAMRHANRMQKQGQKVAAMKKPKLKDEKEFSLDEREEKGAEKSDPKKEIEEIRETTHVKAEALTEQKRQTDVAQGRDPQLTPQEQVKDAVVKEAQVQKEQVNKGQLAEAQVVANNSQSTAMSGMIDLMKALLPVQLPDIRDKSQQQSGPKL